MRMSLSKMSIKSTLFGIILLTTSIVVAFSATSLWSAAERYGNSRTVSQLADLNRSLFVALGQTRQERGNTASALSLPDERNREIVAAFMANRSQVDQALGEAQARLAALGLESLAAVARSIRADHEAMGPLRLAIDNSLKQPLEARDKALVSRILTLGSTFLATLEKASLATETEIRRLDPTQSDLAFIRELGWSSRSLGSNAWVSLIQIVAQGRPLEPREITEIIAFEAAQEATWNAIRPLVASEPRFAAIKHAMAVADDNVFAGSFKTLKDGLFKTVSTGGTPNIEPNLWRQQVTIASDLVGAISKMAIDQLNVTADENTIRARNALVAYAALLLAAFGIVIGGIMLVRRRVIVPLAATTSAMERIAQGDLDVVVPHANRQDEVGAIASALQVFQQNLVKIRALEEQERAASATRLARADSMASIVSDVGEVVSAAAAGDFSARLQIEDAEVQLQELVAGINEINAAVDGATTEFAQVLQGIAGGDLTSRIDTPYRGKFAELKDAINDTVDRLSSMVHTIQVTSADVGLAAREINMGADDLSKRTEEQASSLEETAATTEELAASVKASAQSARLAATTADEAMQGLMAGSTVAGEAVAAMVRIETASNQISDIIRVIDDIAFQTNLLALNAAVEAARAGDAGKGFAVVASEVRALAQRSSSAAKDISGLISTSKDEVANGVRLVRQAGEGLGLVMSASQKAAAAIAEISMAAGEQANGIDEMSQAVAHLDEMTQQNAALSEQSAASAASLSSRIGQLNDLVAAFKTGSQSAHSQLSSRSVTSEPERLRNMAETAFAPRPAAALRLPAKKIVNARGGDAGWEEF